MQLVLARKIASLEIQQYSQLCNNLWLTFLRDKLFKDILHLNEPETQLAQELSHKNRKKGYGEILRPRYAAYLFTIACAN